MSIWHYLFDSDWTQRSDIEDLKQQMRRRSSYAPSVTVVNSDRRTVELENELAEMALLVRSMYVYLKGSPGFDAQRFQEIIERIDLSDGVKDGKVSKRRPSEKAKPAPNYRTRGVRKH